MRCKRTGSADRLLRRGVDKELLDMARTSDPTLASRWQARLEAFAASDRSVVETFIDGTRIELACDPIEVLQRCLPRQTVVGPLPVGATHT
jgi:hypothetical protein